MNYIKNCSYCNEQLGELEKLFANKHVHEMPLCSECIETFYTSWGLIKQ